jgi:hypothetical protein
MKAFLFFSFLLFAIPVHAELDVIVPTKLRPGSFAIIEYNDASSSGMKDAVDVKLCSKVRLGHDRDITTTGGVTSQISFYSCPQQTGLSVALCGGTTLINSAAEMLGDESIAGGDAFDATYQVRWGYVSTRRQASPGVGSVSRGYIYCEGK